MDQMLFNWVVGVAGVLGGWTLKVIWDSLQILRQDIKLMDNKLHEDFVRRDDFKEAIAEIKMDMKEGFRGINNTLGLIFKRLESKEDKE